MPAATLIIEAPTRISSFAVDATYVYWSDGRGGEASRAGRVMRHARAGGADEVLSEGRFNPGDLLAGAATLYWTDGGDLVSCSRLLAMDEGTREIHDLTAAVGEPCRMRPVDEYQGQLLVLAEDPASVTSRPGSVLLRVDPAGAAPAQVVTRFDGPVDASPGVSRRGTSFYVEQPDDDDLLVLRADLESSSQAPAFDWRFEETTGFAVAGDDFYWVDQRYVDRSDLHRRSVRGDLTDELVASFEGGIGGEPVADGDHLWLFAGGRSDEDPLVYLRVTLAGGQVDRFAAPYHVLGRPQVRPEGLYVVDGARLYLQPRP
jgi:hypothetical protein